MNILAGTWYLRKMLKRYEATDDPLPYGLGAYNAGASNVARWRKGAAATNSITFMNQITYPRTKQYIEAVTQRFIYYSRSRTVSTHRLLDRAKRES